MAEVPPKFSATSSDALVSRAAKLASIVFSSALKVGSAKKAKIPEVPTDEDAAVLTNVKRPDGPRFEATPPATIGVELTREEAEFNAILSLTAAGGPVVNWAARDTLVVLPVEALDKGPIKAGAGVAITPVTAGASGCGVVVDVPIASLEIAVVVIPEIAGVNNPVD